MDDSLYIAVDLGAGSGRVFLAGVSSGELMLEEVRRFHYPACESKGHLRWDFARIFDEIKSGLREAAERAKEIGRTVYSIGVDSWGVDYGLINGDGELMENPVCYRDERTRNIMERAFAQIPRDEIFARTGIQFMQFNTLFQLYAHKKEGSLFNAKELLLMPDLINYFLTGRGVVEYTNATTTQIVNAETKSWDSEILKKLKLPANLFPEIIFAGEEIGTLKDAIADELKLENVRVVAPATHDTGSAVAGAPLEDGWAYISSGTWSLVGVERYSPLINADVSRHNFTNEGGAFGTFRFLKNVMGLWILESCRREWQERGHGVDYDSLLKQVEAIEDFAGLIYADDERFFNPQSMLDAIAEQLKESGQTVSDNPFVITKIVLDSLAFRYASVLKTIESLTGQKIKGVQIVGGGSQNDYLNQMTANATNINVAAGPVEATVIGNVLVQACSSGQYKSLLEARRHVAQNVCIKRFVPRTSVAFENARRRYDEIEKRYAS